MKKNKIKGTIIYYHNDMPINCKTYRDKTDRDKSIQLFLNKIKGATGISYYIINPDVKVDFYSLMPDQIVERSIEKHKAANGITNKNYGRLIKRQRNFKPFDDKR